MNRTALLGAGVLLAGVAGGVLAGVWVFRNVDAHLLLQEQALTARIPGPIPISADVLNNLEILIDSDITTVVPIDQRITVPVNETLHIMASFDSDVPIRMTVPVRDFITIDQELDVDTVVKAEMLGDQHDLPLKGKIPVKARVPVKLDIPIDQMVHLKFTAPVEARLKQALDVPLKAEIRTTIPIKSQMSIPVKSALEANVTIPGPVDLTVIHADLRLPLSTLRLGVGQAQGEAP